MNQFHRIFLAPFRAFDPQQVESLLQDRVQTTRNNSAGCQIMLPSSVFTEEASSWISEHGCSIACAVLFYTRPHAELWWHTDGEARDLAKFNWVWGAEDHEMQFALALEGRSSQRFPTAVGTAYEPWSTMDLDRPVSVPVAPAYMMNGNVPHRVINRDTSARWCINMILTENSERLGWNRALDLFDQYLICP
jgi:hypothetical protein